MPPIDYRALANEIAQQHGIPPALFAKLIGAESGWNPMAKSPVGAIGLGQLMPGTAKTLGVNPLDPVQNLQGSATYLAGMYQKFGKWDLALAAYNAGPAAVAHYGGIPPFSETQNYVRKIMGGGVPQMPTGQPTGPDLPPAPGPPQPALPGSPIGLPAQGASPADPLAQAMAMSQPSGSDASILGRLGGMAGRAAQASSEPIPLPTPSPVAVTPSVPIPNQVGATSTDNAVVQLARKYVGTPYVWGGASPRSGFDCSGLLKYVWAQQGVDIPRTSQQQFRAGTPVPLNKLRPGDAIFFHNTATGPGHVVMYIGNGQVIESPHTGAVVHVSSLAGRKDLVGARRFG